LDARQQRGKAKRRDQQDSLHFGSDSGNFVLATQVRWHGLGAGNAACRSSYHAAWPTAIRQADPKSGSGVTLFAVKGDEAIVARWRHPKATGGGCAARPIGASARIPKEFVRAVGIRPDRVTRALAIDSDGRVRIHVGSGQDLRPVTDRRDPELYERWCH
jgi:hypothetical protein